MGHWRPQAARDRERRRARPDHVDPRHAERFDVLGLALLSPGLALMIYGLAESASSGGFGATEVWAPALIGAALVVGFVIHALRTPHALIDLRLLIVPALLAALLLPFVKPEPVEDEQEGGAGEPAPVLMHA